MKAIVQDHYGSEESLQLDDVERPRSATTRSWSASMQRQSMSGIGCS